MLSTIAAVDVVIVVNRGTKLAAVQVNFRDGGVRHYLITHRPHRGSKATGKPSETSVRSFSDATATGLDLRNKQDAIDLETTLTNLELQ